MTKTPSPVVNIDEVEEMEHRVGEHFGGFDRAMTPSMQPRGGSLGVSYSRVPPGKTMCPFHYHQREDEAFFVLSGRGLFRYGGDVRTVRAGDCISCPAGTGVAHQLANPFTEDLVYLAIGVNDPHEVCVYPDSGKVLVRSLQRVGFLENVDYFEGEPPTPKIFELAKRG
jgi:uncharacterized cupin superfamily protein